ncbi:MAG: hypothetical protein Q9190_001460 [Brigantiaea leucoxantha]
MHGFEWKDQRGIEGTGFVRALRSLLTSNLPSLVTRFEIIIDEQFRNHISKGQIIRDMIQDHGRVADHTLSFIAKLVTRGHRNSKVMYELLFPLVEKRLKHRAFGNMEQQQDKPATTYAIADLYSHNECIELLRNEAESYSLAEFKDTAGGLPLLDSFLRESARLSASESTGIRRQALKPFVFTDGLRISAGDWVCIPHRCMMRDNKFVENASEFDAFRSMNVSLRNCSSSRPTKLVDASKDWLVWGSGRTVCPGRFYANAEDRWPQISTMALGYYSKGKYVSTYEASTISERRVSFWETPGFCR